MTPGIIKTYRSAPRNLERWVEKVGPLGGENLLLAE
jgi:hypothetical protein